jgi:hypothetical protein
MLAPVRAAPFPLEAAVSARVGTALEKALLRHGLAQNELRAAIEACVDALHDQGMSPEGVVITIKALMLHSVSVAAPAAQAQTLLAAEYFMNDVVGWCVTDYFRAR